MSWTTASRLPRMRLTSVDLPTFGRPTTASTGTGPVVPSPPASKASADAQPEVWSSLIGSRPGGVGALAGERHDLLDDVVERQLGRVDDDGVGGGGQRRSGAGRVVPVAAQQIGLDGRDVSLLADGRLC